MKNFISLLMLISSCGSFGVFAQDQGREVQGSWQIGVGVGELPMDGSFKPSITAGYHFNERIYTGIIYQFDDNIQRNESSFNAKSSGLDGLDRSHESVAQRFLLQLRYQPFKHGPYLSGGFVFNGKDTESMVFDSRARTIEGEEYAGTLQIDQTRSAGWGVAMGLGYQYNFRNGISIGFEWTPAWGQYPTPSYEYSGSSDLSAEAQKMLEEKMNSRFTSSVTNLYKVFHVGLSCRF